MQIIKILSIIFGIISVLFFVTAGYFGDGLQAILQLFGFVNININGTLDGPAKWYFILAVVVFVAMVIIS